MGSFPEKYNDRKSLTEFETGKKIAWSLVKGVSVRSIKKWLKPSHIDGCLCEVIIQITIFCNDLSMCKGILIQLSLT